MLPDLSGDDGYDIRAFLPECLRSVGGTDDRKLGDLHGDHSQRLCMRIQPLGPHIRKSHIRQRTGHGIDMRIPAQGRIFFSGYDPKQQHNRKQQHAADSSQPVKQ